MREHLATLLDYFRRYDREIAVVRYQGRGTVQMRRKMSSP